MCYRYTTGQSSGLYSGGVTDPWNPAQYERFKAERSQPFFDLLALVRPEPGMRVVDLGCGTGELTRALHERLAPAGTLGVDNSDAMLAKAAAFTVKGLTFQKGDIAAFPAEPPWDLVFSNAALQWIDDQEGILQRLTAAVAPGGQLAFQVPASFDHVSHATAAEVARMEPFRTALGGHTRGAPVLAPDAYSLLLHRLGYAEQHVRLQVYGHRLASRDEMIEWVKGTLLTDYARRMPKELFPEFLERYRETLLPRLPDTRPFFYPFKRILAWARK